MLQLNEFSKAPLSARISRWSPNMKAFFLLSIDRRFAVSIFVMRRRAKFNENSARKQLVARTIALPFGFLLCQTTPFVPPFFLHFDNWTIYQINGWHRSDLVFPSVKDVDLWNSNQSIFLGRNKVDGADLGAFVKYPFLHWNVFFTFLIDCLVRTLIFE